jgi:hypothetical protein
MSGWKVMLASPTSADPLKPLQPVVPVTSPFSSISKYASGSDWPATVAPAACSSSSTHRLPTIGTAGSVEPSDPESPGTAVVSSPLSLPPQAASKAMLATAARVPSRRISMGRTPGLRRSWVARSYRQVAPWGYRLVATC